MKTRNLLILILAIVIAAGGFYIYWTWNSPSPNQKLIETNEKKIDSLQGLIDNQKKKIVENKVTAKTLVTAQDSLIKIADSLRLAAQKPIPCAHKVLIQEKEIGALRGALNKCKEVTFIKTRTIGICDTIIIQHEAINASNMTIIKVQKKEKKKAFLKGAGIGAGLGLLIALIVI